ncbi:MAG: polyphosphate kinase 2 family protein [Sandaracinaceae bacterium]|jgi:PPK2 family polyphosphate:nucleotide phosphotransferase|nr:polyphosphate kinase 2 family protein [Sandaracinaceae bacterium]
MKSIELDSPFLVPTDGSFRIKKHAHTHAPKKSPGETECNALLRADVEQIAALQRKLYAADTWAVLLVFQAMDAAGKDGTIRAVMSGIDPSGCQVSSFKAPSHVELDHDFLWRTSRALPERGRIGVFNRSYYEEVLVVRVHPEYLKGQNIPTLPKSPAKVWEHRLESIADHEKHLARNGVAVVKFWLNVSKKEQKKRFLDRIDDEEANWKFQEGDVHERRHWNKYMNAYEEALRATSRPWAPWYAIPADDKHFMRHAVARVVRKTIAGLDVNYPALEAEKKKRLASIRRLLQAAR